MVPVCAHSQPRVQQKTFCVKREQEQRNPQSHRCPGDDIQFPVLKLCTESKPQKETEHRLSLDLADSFTLSETFDNFPLSLAGFRGRVQKCLDTVDTPGVQPAGVRH